MLENEFINETKNVSDLTYLTEMMGHKKNLIKGVIDAFLIQVIEELRQINEAVTKTDYKIIKSLAHAMRSSVSMMGISVLNPLLKEMEDIAATATGSEKIKELNTQLNLICKQAIAEIEQKKHNYE